MSSLNSVGHTSNFFTCLIVLYERSGDLIAHVKFTILLQSGGTVKITGLDMPSGFAASDENLPEDLKTLLAEATATKKKKDRKKTKKQGGESATEEAS